MKFQEYKTQTLARPDITDILLIEPAEKIPVVKEGKKTGEYVVKVHTSESGRTRTKYDVHLVQTVPQQQVEKDGTITNLTQEEYPIEQITVVDEGKETEEVQLRKRVAEVDPRTEMDKVKTFLPDVEKTYVRVEGITYNAKDMSAEFTGVKDNGDGTVTKERRFGWVDAQGQPQTRILPKDKQ